MCGCGLCVQLQKVYKDDMGGIEAQEDLARMREHALSEVSYRTGL